MPKKQSTKHKTTKFPFAHPTKHGRLHWKKVLYIVLGGAFGLVLVAAVTAQVIYNKLLWDWASEQSTVKITLLIQSALEGLESIKAEPGDAEDGRQLIPESRLALPAETDEVRRLLYHYNAADSGTDGAGYTWDYPETVQVTTKQLAVQSRTRLMTGHKTEDVFNLLPAAQACNRGFTLQFTGENENGLRLSGQRQLSDGRTLYVFREPACNFDEDTVDALETYLLQAQSY
ncbi:MAG: hypothetical protein WAQ57_00835 [Candidatus Saccharimonadales bacterium]